MTDTINAITQGAIWAVLLVYFILPALSDLWLLIESRFGGLGANGCEGGYNQGGRWAPASRCGAGCGPSVGEWKDCGVFSTHGNKPIADGYSVGTNLYKKE